MTHTFASDMLKDPFFIGFDHMLDRMRATTPGQTNYPPYNIVKTDEHHYAIEIAIAGFNQDELDIELKDGVLTVEGKKDSGADEVTTRYLHKGISARSFRRAFTLSDTIVVSGADLTDGILTIHLENVIPEEKKPRKIEIGYTGKAEPTLLQG